MRRSGRCAKCDHDELLHLAQVTDLGHNWRPVPWSITTCEERGRSVPYGQVEAYVCRGCGYTEFYVRAPQSVPVDDPAVEVLKGSKPQGPYR